MHSAGPAAPASIELRDARLAVTLFSPMRVTVGLFDTRGRLAAQTVDRVLPAGTHDLPVFDNGVSAGVSVVRVRIGGHMHV